MIETQRALEYTASVTLGTAPDGDVTVTLTHEYGGDVVTAQTATAVDSTNFEYDFSAEDTKSAGVHKLTWTYQLSGVETTTEDHISFFEPYTNLVEFFIDFPDLEAEEDYFTRIERQARGIIHSFCGQVFAPIYSQRLEVDGSGRRNLFLPNKINSFTEVLIAETSSTGTTTTDITSYVEKIPETRDWIRFMGLSSKFSSGSIVYVTGDWGWLYVPTNVSEAEKLIIADLLGDDVNYIKHGVTESYMDTHRLRFHESIFGSTGNLDADTLLMDYTLMGMGLI